MMPRSRRLVVIQEWNGKFYHSVLLSKADKTLVHHVK